MTRQITATPNPPSATVKGTGYPQSQIVMIAIGDVRKRVRTDKTGSFTDSQVPIPEGASGDVLVEAYQESMSATTTLHLGQAPAPTPAPTPSPTPTPAPSPTPPVPAGSPPMMPVGDLPGWKQIFAEDFNDPAPLGKFDQVYGDRWYSYGPGWKQTFGFDNPARYDSPHTVSVKDGILDIYLHQETIPDERGVVGGWWLSAALEPYIKGKPNADQLYGCYAVCIRCPQPVPTYKTAYLLWPQSGNWPHDGEIDFPEGGLDSRISAYMHRQDAAPNDGGDQDAYETPTTYDDWHVAVIEWGPDHCRFILDDKVIGDSTQRIPNTPMHWVLQSEACWGGTPPAGATGHLQIAWATVYARS